ncbi:MAG: family 10 glycosylhydrolase [Lentisphaerae bacterium]|nr:family 10 glycosylhydrolase [Lentisphaerota bacterium]MBT5610778.1 family 10 glycosylhydrolase [Lentisphaerota bacterium]MBT7053790.1 family 10 glycosylhydrolase [Lentisphaerota bacterium]MBT7841251.1 family 10 glycosylhydrolase [Lentisphaerota bacterium]
MGRSVHLWSLAAALVCGFGEFCSGQAPPRTTPFPENALNVSWGDHIVVSKGAARLDSPEHIHESLARWRELGSITTVYWRISSWVLDRYFENRRKGFEWYTGPLREIEGRCDPRVEALKSCRRLDLPILGYLCIFDEGSPTSIRYGDNAPFPWQSHFTLKHPEFLVCDRAQESRHFGVMEYWYPEVRKYKISVITDFLEAHDFDGVYVCTRTHSRPADHADQYGFNEPVVDEYRKRYGLDIRVQPFDVQRWRDLRGEGLTLFLRELRAVLKQRGKQLALGIPRSDIVGPPYGNMTLHWRTWLREQLVDEIVIGVNSGNFHYPSVRGKDRERGYLASGDEGFGLRPLAEDIRSVYGPLCERHGVKLRVSGRGSAVIPPLAGGMISSLSFGSHTIRVSVAPAPVLDLQSPASTVDFWVRPEQTADAPRIVSKYNHTLGEEGRGWEIMIGKDDRIVFRFAAAGKDAHVRSRATIQTGEWNHVACGFMGPGKPPFIVVNGKAGIEGDASGFVPRAVPVSLCLGIYAGGGRPLEGAVAQVRIWDQHVLFDAEGKRLGEDDLNPVFELGMVRRDGAAFPRVLVPQGLPLTATGDVSAHIGRGPRTEGSALIFSK